MAKRKNRTGYETYKIQFEELQKKLKSKGIDTSSVVPYTELQFKTITEAYKNDRKDEILEGKRKTIGNIQRDLTKDQFRVRSKKQAQNIKMALEAKGQKTTLRDLLYTKETTKEEDFWESIKNRKETLKQLGVNSIEITHIISQEFFGSE